MKAFKENQVEFQNDEQDESLHHSQLNIDMGSAKLTQN